jgi:hypothetical protein
MTPRRHPLLGIALLIGVLTLLPGLSLGANKPPKPAPMLGSHPTREAKSARLAVLKQRTSNFPLKTVRPVKLANSTANSLNHRPVKTIVVPRKLPK